MWRRIAEIAVVATVSLTMMTLAMCVAGFMLAVAWSRSVSVLLDLPEISTSQSIWLLVSLWIIGLPLRGFTPPKSGSVKQ